MAKIITGLLVTTLLVLSAPARAQLSTDAPILLKMLANNITQLYQLYSIVQQGRESLMRARELSRGVSSALELARTVDPSIDPGIYKDWHDVPAALAAIASIYGDVPVTVAAEAQARTDALVAEAVTLNNSVYDYAKQLDQIGAEIKSKSVLASAKGAQRIAAQGIGVLTHAVNQGLKIQATQLKLHAQALALRNKEEKDQARLVAETNATMAQSMRQARFNFSTPRLTP